MLKKSIEVLKKSLTRHIGIRATEAIVSGFIEYDEGYVYFSIKGIECRYGLWTSPPLWEICETSQEFTSFEDLEANVEDID